MQNLLPMYQKKLAYGTKGFPWKSNISKRNISYKKGICPVAERLNKDKLIIIELCVYEFNNSELKQLVNCFKKVWANLDSLKKFN